MVQISPVVESLQKVVFNCPHCKVHAQHFMFYIKDIRNLEYNSYLKYDGHPLVFYMCENCEKPNFWIGGDEKYMAFPDVSNFLPPDDNMPPNIKEIYNEATAIANKSPRAATALMRLALQELCKELQCEGKTLQENIDFLVREKRITSSIEKAMDAVRIVGNEAVHPGTIDLQDNVEMAATMFKLINFIVQQTISVPKEIESIHDSLPDSKKRKRNE